MLRFRVVAVLLLSGFVLGACGQARATPAPAPEFVSSKRAEPTDIPATSLADHGGDEITLESIEADIASGDGNAEINVNQMFMTDDAGNPSPNRAAWEVFDAELASRLIPASHAASVAIMVDGEIVHTAAYGERIPGNGEPVAVTDRFRIASISKTVSAIVAMQLVDRGTLTLDQDVGVIVADHLGATKVDPDVASITLRELLSHTSGFPQHYSTFFGNTVTSCPQAATIGIAANVRAGGFDYSNMNYCVLSILIEAVTGKTYERVVDEMLLTPLGISGMRFTGTYELGPDEVSHAPTPGRTFMETLGGAGAWNATPSDVVRIINAINPDTDGWKALTPDSMQQMRYRSTPTGPAPGYGLGIINYGGNSYGHTGTIERAHSMVLVQPNGVTWAVTVAGTYPSESDNLRSIVNRALSSAFPGI